jgi:hypothetical protein
MWPFKPKEPRRAAPDASASASDPTSVPISDPRLVVLPEIPIGACFYENTPGPDDRIHGYIVLSCSERHPLEMFGRGPIPDSWHAGYPGDSAIAAGAVAVCRPLFVEYVGRDYDSSVYTYWHYAPDNDDFWPGEATIHCALGNKDRSFHEMGTAKCGGQ